MNLRSALSLLFLVAPEKNVVKVFCFGCFAFSSAAAACALACSASAALYTSRCLFFMCEASELVLLPHLMSPHLTSRLQRSQFASLLLHVYTWKWLWTHDLVPGILIRKSGSSLGGGEKATELDTEPGSGTETESISRALKC